jgi:mannose-1-phosphate guanylyltransferase
VSEAVLLVGGLGTRLRPLTINTPKPMLPVAGVPFVTHQIVRAVAAGVEHIVLATSYKAEVFADALGDGSSLGLDISYMVEDEPLGTGGAIRNAAQRLRSAGDDPILIFNGDVLDGHDIAAQLARHQEWDADVTLYLTEVEDPRAFGSVLTAEDQSVTAFLEKTPEPVTNRVNAGCYVFRRSVIDEIPPGRPVSVERETFPSLLESQRRLMSHIDRAYWTDLGTPALYVRGSADLVRGLIVPSARPGPPGERLVLPGADVHPSARIEGGASVLPGAVVGEEAVVDGSVVMAGARIGARAWVTRSAVGERAVVGDDCHLDHAVIGDDATIGRDNELRAGVRVSTGLELPARAIRFS